MSIRDFFQNILKNLTNPKLLNSNISINSLLKVHIK